MAGPLRATLFVLLVLSHAATADVPPVETFFRPADIEDAQLSPSGRWLALTSVGSGSRVALFVFDLSEIESPRQIVRIPDADIRDVRWTSDERVVFRVVDRFAGGGDQKFGAGLHTVRRDGSDLRTLVKSVFTVWDRSAALEPNHVLLFVPPATPDVVIVGEVRGNTSREPTVRPKRLNVKTQRTEILFEGAPDPLSAWRFDPYGEPRVLEAVYRGETAFYWRSPGTTTWKEIARQPTLHRAFIPRFVDREGTLYVTVAAGPEGYQELRRFDFVTGRPSAEATVRTPGFDFTGAFIEDGEGRLLGIRVFTDAETTVWLDPRLKAMQALADARFPGRVNSLDCGRQCSGEALTVLVRSYSDQDPGSLWVYYEAQQRWQFVARMRKDVDPGEMARMDFHRIRARDGRDLPVWVTGAATSQAERRPAVVLVHGGPWMRGAIWGWHAEAQFLASRGYVVIEPEYRGSLGYGRAHYAAGWKQWGRAMQDDLVDAVRWTVERGWVDPRRVCIAGGSYGGYAALMGVVRDPEVFRCAAAWVAVTDPRLMFEWDALNDASDEGRLHSLPQLIGDPFADEATFREIAPVEQAARIKSPVLLAFGKRDRRVPIEHGTKMRKALQAAGQTPVWVEYDDEAHGWFKTETRVDFAKRLERFLGTHLKQSDPAPISATPVR